MMVFTRFGVVFSVLHCLPLLIRLNQFVAALSAKKKNNEKSAEFPLEKEKASSPPVLSSFKSSRLPSRKQIIVTKEGKTLTRRTRQARGKTTWYVGMELLDKNQFPK